MERQPSDLPPIRWFVIAVTLATLSYILLAIVAVPKSQPDAFHFLDERGAITALSAIFLAMACAFSFCTGMVRLRQKARDVGFWFLMVMAFGFLSLDELLQFHEIVGRMIGRTWGSGPFRNWNDIIVILYGLLALPIALLFLPSLLRIKGVLECFVTAMIFYGLHTLIDSIQEPPTTVSFMLEESCKLLCGAFLALGTFAGFLGSLWCFELSDERAISSAASASEVSLGGHEHCKRGEDKSHEVEKAPPVKLR